MYNDGKRQHLVSRMTTLALALKNSVLIIRLYERISVWKPQLPQLEEGGCNLWVWSYSSRVEISLNTGDVWPRASFTSCFTPVKHSSASVHPWGEVKNTRLFLSCIHNHTSKMYFVFLLKNTQVQIEKKVQSTHCFITDPSSTHDLSRTATNDSFQYNLIWQLFLWLMNRLAYKM